MTLNTLAIGKDAVVAVVSSEVFDEGVESLTKEQIKKIYLGEINNWKEIGGPDKEILVIDKESSRGTRHVFMKAIMGDENAKANGADLVLGLNNEQQTAIIQSDRAIGMLSYAWLNNDVKGISIDLGDVKIEPIPSTILNGKYPIIRDLNLITTNEIKEASTKFIAFVMSKQGQKIVTEKGYVEYE